MTLRYVPIGRVITYLSVKTRTLQKDALAHGTLVFIRIQKKPLDSTKKIASTRHVTYTH